VTWTALTNQTQLKRRRNTLIRSAIPSNFGNWQPVTIDGNLTAGSERFMYDIVDTIKLSFSHKVGLAPMIHDLPTNVLGSNIKSLISGVNGIIDPVNLRHKL
jgi:hypothetical protein